MLTRTFQSLSSLSDKIARRMSILPDMSAERYTLKNWRGFFYTRAVKHILCDLGEKTSERCRELKVGDLHLERIVNVKGEHWTRVLQNGRCVFMSYIDGTDQWCSVERYDIGSSASWGKRILRLYDDLPDIKRKLDDRDPSVMLYYDKHQMERPSAAATADSPTVHLRHARPGNSLS